MPTNEEILNNARDLFGKYGYFGTSIADIAKKTNISKTAVFYYFKSKKELYKKVVENAFKDLERHIKKVEKIKNPTEKLLGLIKNYLDFSLKEKNILFSSMLDFSKEDAEIKLHIKKLKEKLNDNIEMILKDSFKIYAKERKDFKNLTTTLTEIMNGKVLEFSFLKSKINLKKSAKKIIEVLFK